MSEPTVSIIDDDPSARRGLTRLVRAAGMNVKSFASAHDFLASGLQGGQGCIVLDVRMPDMTGPELQEELAKAEYCMPIIFLSAHADVPTTARTMKKGAVDFLTKPVDGKALLEAIRLSLAKDAENCAQLAETASIRERFKRLTPRELQITSYVITGMLNKQIAGDIGVTEGTVKIHRGRAMHKLGIESVPELVRLCEEAGIAPAEPLSR
jgi:FixJ family two-component response regulator